MMERVAVVVATYQRRSLLAESIASIRRSVGRLDHSIIVVDGGSTDGTLEWLEAQADVHLIRQQFPLTGAVRAYNLGFRHAIQGHFPWIAYVNDDDLFIGPTPEIERAIEIMRGAPILGGVAFEFDLRGPFAAEYWHGRAYINKGVVRREAGMAAAIAQGDPTGSAWWNPDYHTYGADSEFGNWMWKLGWRIHVEPGLRVHDRRGESLDAMRACNEAQHHAAGGGGSLFWSRWGHAGSNDPLKQEAFVWWTDLDRYAVNKYYSQSGEDGILRHILTSLGTEPSTAPSPFLVDVGAGDGYTLSNTRYFLDNGWRGEMFDVGHHDGVNHAFFTGANAALILAQHGVARDFDLLSLDIDGQDFWVLIDILQHHRPRVIVAEINGSRPRFPAVTVPFYPPWAHDGTNYYGMSLGALERVGTAFGYTLIHQRLSLNGFLVRSDLLPAHVIPDVPFVLSHGHPPDQGHRPWHEVTDADMRR